MKNWVQRCKVGKRKFLRSRLLRPSEKHWQNSVSREIVKHRRVLSTCMTPELYNLYVKGFRHLRFSHRHPTAIRWLQGVSTIVRTHYNLCKKNSDLPRLSVLQGLTWCCLVKIPKSRYVAVGVVNGTPLNGKNVSKMWKLKCDLDVSMCGESWYWWEIPTTTKSDTLTSRCS